MQGKATFGGHPIHPVLVAYPMGFYVGSLISDILFYFTKLPMWVSFSEALIGFGVVGALLAALFGFIDYFSAPMSAEIKSTATLHMIINLVVTLIFVVDFFVRQQNGTSVAGYVLTVIGVILLMVAGYLGGHLAYVGKVGVKEDAQASGSH